MSVSIFFCYAHEDEALLNKLRAHLRPLQRQGLIAVWHDRDISAGTEWEEDINKHLNEAKIILLLVSPDFMDSDYCYGKEMQRALERHRRGEARVIPIILRPVYWKGILGTLQALPTDAKPVKSWPDVDAAFYDVTEGIRTVVAQLEEERLAEQARLAEQERLAEAERVRQAEEQAHRAGLARSSAARLTDGAPAVLTTAPARPLPSLKPATIALLRTLSGHTEGVYSVAFSPDGQTLASGSHDTTIKLWDVASGKELRTLTGHTYRVTSVAFSPDGQTLASGSGDTTIKLWNLANSQAVRTLTGHTGYVFNVAFSPDGQTLASGSADQTIKLWDLTSGQAVRTLTGHTSSVSSVAFSPDGQTLASGSYQAIKLWNLANGQAVRTLSGHTDAVSSVAFSPDGQTLASGSLDTTIKLWHLASGQAVRTLGKTLRILSWRKDPVNSVAFSPDGQTLASGSGDRTIKLWGEK